MDDLKIYAQKIIQSAINAVKPDLLIQRRVRLEGDNLIIGDRIFNLSAYKNIYVIGAGKASAWMGLEIEKILRDRIKAGVITVKYGHKAPTKIIQILEAGHPVIDQNSLEGTEKVLELVEKAGFEDLVICLISGGGSALLEKLPVGILLDDLQIVFKSLLNCGANIEEINIVRKHLSLVKGGQLARAIAPAHCISLILSDVIGDPLESIASGPTAADKSTFSDAWNVIKKYDLENNLPSAIHNYLQMGVAGKKPETVKPGDPILERVENIILGNNWEALISAKQTAEELGFNTLILTSRVQGEAREVARVLTAIVKEIQTRNVPLPKPACVLLGGETTVTIKGKGLGGRNQELALAALIEMKETTGPYIIVSCGTDGTDGPTDAAGGWATPGIWEKAREFQLNPLEYLNNNDSYNFLKQTGGLIQTGPTGTNVMDIIFALVSE